MCFDVGLEPLADVIARLLDGLTKAPPPLGACVTGPTRGLRHSGVAAEENGLAPTDAGDMGRDSEGSQRPMLGSGAVLDHRLMPADHENGGRSRPAGTLAAQGWGAARGNLGKIGSIRAAEVEEGEGQTVQKAEITGGGVIWDFPAAESAAPLAG